MSVSDDERIVEMRNSVLTDKTILDFPFLFIQGQFGYSADSIQRHINSQTLINLGVYPNTFPNTITEYYWIQGCKDICPGQQWHALGKLENGVYFLYTAYCGASKTFLNNGGHMNLWVSRHYSDLIHYAMNLETYKKYIDETSAIVQPVIESVGQTDARPQMSRQALDALIKSGAFVPPVQAVQSPSSQSHAQEPQ
jgi:hypothetical protein